ncbi:TPA: type III pantothenate kinase [bacterium]|nr:type III pantothenate kinase [bacterium]
MLLAFDVGNSNINVGLFYGNDIIGDLRIHTDINKTCDEFGLLILDYLERKGIENKQITGIIISSVVPIVTSQLKEMSSKWFGEKPVIVSSDLKLGIKIDYDNPNELGADRIVNAVAGYAEYGGALIIVDLGTAITFDVISEEGIFIGGAITAGIGTSIEALAGETALLPKIDITQPLQAIGKNTISCMQSGFYFGFLGQIEEIIRRISSELPNKPKVIATGGFCNKIANNSGLIDHIDPDLTLKGLRLIYDRVILDKLD